MSKALAHIQHVVVLMLENRSLDHLCGFLYSGAHGPRHVLPAGSSPGFNGMPLSYSNPSNPGYFNGSGPPNPVAVHAGAHDRGVPHEDPQEVFEDINLQLFGTETPLANQHATMNGFLISYQRTKPANPNEIMECYTPDQLPVISTLAREFAISDAWYASVPTQTWPNRAYFHLGTSRGKINNYPYDPFDYDVPTIFNVLEQQKISWAVYNDSIFESATRLQFPQLWDLLLEPRFQNLSTFEEDARNGRLPAYSFLEPSFIVDPNDAHPPHDLLLAEQLVWRVWNAVSTGAHWDSTLLVITFDEHGGCIDHQPPPENAVAPDDQLAANAFAFNRYGVRIPTIAISPWIEAGTVFRSPTDAPYDHTSVLATIRDWQRIPKDRMLSSRRIAAAPTLEHLLTRSEARREIPAIPYPTGIAIKQEMHLAPNDFQKALLVALGHRVGLRGGVKLLENVRHRKHVANFFQAYKERHHRGR